VQGFYLGRPAPADAVTGMLQKLWVPVTAR
jgi:EAL domain-containing protein (putative c-di-GMP-specific phosphodiesterase class I)